MQRRQPELYVHALSLCGQPHVPAEGALRLVRFFFFRLIFFPWRVVSCADSWHFKHRVYSVAWSKNGKQVASGSRDKSVKIWETSTGECVSTLTGHSRYVTAVSYSCLFSNVWCVLNIEHFTAMFRVFPSAQMAQNWRVAAGTPALEFGRRRLARACRP